MVILAEKFLIWLQKWAQSIIFFSKIFLLFWKAQYID